MLLRDVVGERAQGVLQAPGGRRAAGRPGTACAVRDLAMNFGDSMICVPFVRHARRRRGAASARDAALPAPALSDLEQRELPVELVELDRERQEVAAAQRAAAAQLMQRILELPRRGFQRRELERRGIAPHPVDFLERLLELVAKRLLLARRLLQHRVDGLHRGVGSLQQGGKARPAHLQDAAQDLALRLHLHPQILQLARRLHLRVMSVTRTSQTRCSFERARPR